MSGYRKQVEKIRQEDESQFTNMTQEEARSQIIGKKGRDDISSKCKATSSCIKKSWRNFIEIGNPATQAIFKLF